MIICRSQYLTQISDELLFLCRLARAPAQGLLPLGQSCLSAVAGIVSFLAKAWIVLDPVGFEFPLDFGKLSLMQPLTFAGQDAVAADHQMDVQAVGLGMDNTDGEMLGGTTLQVHLCKMKQRLSLFGDGYPALYVSASCEVQPEFREYERFSTALINAFLQPEVSRYMRRLRATVGQLAPNAKLGIFQSSGGLMSIEKAAAFPVRTALSGPAAGAVGAAASGALSAIGNIITLDMGGTSTDVCLIKDGETEIAGSRDVAGFRIRLPMVDIHTVGAGGGSIAHIGPDGLMKVGPQSAGAVPGPACYGTGGVAPTVSDANAVLGRLPEKLAGGALMIDVEKAQAVIAGIAGDLDTSPVKAALGVVGIAVSNMTRAIRAVSTERGHDPRRFTLMPFGGAGGLHAVEVAASLGMTRILVPYAPGILCADGLIQSDLEENFVTTCRTALNEAHDKVPDVLAALSRRANDWIAGEAGDAGDATDATKSVQLDMRYIGQNYELSIPIYRGSGDLPAGTRLDGPVIITQLDATTVVPPRATVTVDPALNLIVEIENV